MRCMLKEPMYKSRFRSFLAALRYTESGMQKRAAWEEVWRLQRREDAGQDVGAIPVPPKYAQADFARNGYWQRRGKLDSLCSEFLAQAARYGFSAADVLAAIKDLSERRASS